jgi:predicted glycosyltransferase
VNRHFDLVLVHSDPRLQRLEETFFRASALKCPISYTGFVTEPLARGNPQQRGNRPRVIASAGGGRVGFGLLSAVVDGSRLLASTVPHDLFVYTGPYLSGDEFEQLLRSARDLPHCVVQRFAADFLERMGAADLVVSMAGYNTCMNILTTGVRAIVVPFTGNQNEEQTIRARKLAALGLVEVVDAGELSPAAIAQAMQAALGRPMRRTAVSLDLNGVSNTARLLKEVSERILCHV